MAFTQALALSAHRFSGQRHLDRNRFDDRGCAALVDDDENLRMGFSISDV